MATDCATRPPPDDPAERLRFQLEDCGAHLVVTAGGLPDDVVPTLFLAGQQACGDEDGGAHDRGQ